MKNEEAKKKQEWKMKRMKISEEIRSYCSHRLKIVSIQFNHIQEEDIILIRYIAP